MNYEEQRANEIAEEYKNDLRGQQTKKFLIQGEYVQGFGWILDPEIEEASGDEGYWNLRFQNDGLFGFDSKKQAEEAQRKNKIDYDLWDVSF